MDLAKELLDDEFCVKLANFLRWFNPNIDWEIEIKEWKIRNRTQEQVLSRIRSWIWIDKDEEIEDDEIEKYKVVSEAIERWELGKMKKLKEIGEMKEIKTKEVEIEKSEKHEKLEIEKNEEIEINKEIEKIKFNQNNKNSSYSFNSNSDSDCDENNNNVENSSTSELIIEFSSESETSDKSLQKFSQKSLNFVQSNIQNFHDIELIEPLQFSSISCSSKLAKLIESTINGEYDMKNDMKNEKLSYSSEREIDKMENKMENEKDEINSKNSSNNVDNHDNEIFNKLIDEVLSESLHTAQTLIKLPMYSVKCFNILIIDFNGLTAKGESMLIDFIDVTKTILSLRNLKFKCIKFDEIHKIYLENENNENIKNIKNIFPLIDLSWFFMDTSKLEELAEFSKNEKFSSSYIHIPMFGINEINPRDIYFFRMIFDML